MQIFIAKEQLGDYFNYTLNNNDVLINLLNKSKLPLWFKSKFNVDNIGECLYNQECRTFLNDLSSQSNFILSGEQQIQDLYFVTRLINLFGVADELYTAKASLIKNKKWEVETLTKNVTFPSLSKPGKSKCLLKKGTDYFISSVNGVDILENDLVDGTYEIYYQLQNEETEEINYSGELKLEVGDNVISSNNMFLFIYAVGKEKFLEG
jgi:hypothetical protein